MAAKVIYMTLALLLVAAQLGTGKSVDNKLRLKRQEPAAAADQAADTTTATADEETTTLVAPTTTDLPDSESADSTTLKPDDQDPITVRPLAKEDSKSSKQKPKKPISDRIGADNGATASPVAGKAFSEGGSNFAASAASSSSGPQGGHVFAATYPGPDGKPVVQSSSWPGPGGAAVNAIGNGPNNAASASASTGGQKPLAGGKPLVPNFNGGVNGNSASASAGGFGSRINTASSSSGGNGNGNGVKVQTSPNGVSVSSSASAGGDNGVNSIGIRGSFGGDGDSVGIEVNGEPVTVPNKGQGPPGAIPLPAPAAYPGAGGNSNAFAGASAGASAGAGGIAGGQGPRFPPQGAYNGPNPADLLSQYFAALQAQQLAFQRQLQAQIAAQQNANRGASGGGGGVGGSYATGGAIITNSQGQVDPQARVYVSTRSSPDSASSATSISGGNGGGSAWSSASLFPHQSPSPAFANNNNINSYSFAPPMSFGPGGFGSAGQFPAGYPGFGMPPPGFPAGFPSIGGGANSATASASIGPGGGYQQAAVNPPNPNFESRFGEAIPASPGGGSYGVFSSSSSSSGVGPDGKPVNHKQATVAVNNNGKVSVHTVGDQ
ncbi:uncharacterized protein LOC106654926 isoform X2 [Trichogramma pretiosum]|uniref:uncharacterized protein LOC106654926 isoform X2 n=1 Tax=Trichogramma pretiosum TaxID=7493 RepID=UPI0006C97828|nr:uncharacterized protein LOC106654926 isoform X2 [Trichogramma pretiosum]